MPAAPSLLGSTGSTTLVLAGALVVIGIVMICTAMWLVRATRTDVPALGPLEVMGDRRFRRRDAAARQRTLAAARPPGALEPAPMLELDPVVAEVTPTPAASIADLAPAPSPEPVDAVEEPLSAESA